MSADTTKKTIVEVAEKASTPEKRAEIMRRVDRYRRACMIHSSGQEGETNAMELAKAEKELEELPDFMGYSWHGPVFKDSGH